MGHGRDLASSSHPDPVRHLPFKLKPVHVSPEDRPVYSQIIAQLQDVLAVAGEVLGLDAAPGRAQARKQLFLDVEIDARINRREHRRFEDIHPHRNPGKAAAVGEVPNPNPAHFPFFSHLQLQVVPVPGALRIGADGDRDLG